MNKVTVFQYQSGRLFLTDAIAELKRSDPEFSVRRFCKMSGLGSHALLIMLLNGKRKMTLKQVPALAHAFQLNTIERTYLQTLIQLDNSNSVEEKDLYKLWLNDLNPKADLKFVEIEHQQVIANWIHMTILTLGKIEGAELTAENIYVLIHKRISLSEVRQALTRLLDLGLLSEVEGRLIPSQSGVRTKDDVSNKASREYHKQVSMLACESLEEQAPNIREFQSFALTVPEGKISLAKEMIRKFRNQLVLVLEQEPGVDVYQCNIQFFRLTESPLSERSQSKVNEGAEFSIHTEAVN